MAESVLPSLQTIRDSVTRDEKKICVVPIYKQVNIEDDPVTAYSKLYGKDTYLFELASEGDPTKISVSIIGVHPFKTLQTFRDKDPNGDPLVHLESELQRYYTPKNLRLSPSLLNGGAFGYISYDCVRYFETKVDAYPQPDALGIPESFFIFSSSFIVFDMRTPTTEVKIVTLCIVDDNLDSNYADAVKEIDLLETKLRTSKPRDFPTLPVSNTERIENAGEQGYKRMVRILKERIIDGDIIQAVPSHRIGRPTRAHPFNIYKELRALNPSRYGFFIEFGDFQVVGQSPELLVSVIDGVVSTHPIAGTRKRGKTPEEDEELARELLQDEKERAEHIMLVDLGRNDVNRVAQPHTTRVDNLMHIERYSHVMHIVSCVSGQLRPECTQFDAFRSVFPAGTLSGAPKVKAMELIAQLEPDRRGVYGGAVGYFSFDSNVDTSIAIRTIVMKQGIAYLQAGGGIVYDSTEEMEYQETVNKMAATARAIDMAESKITQSETGTLDQPPRDTTAYSQRLSSLLSGTSTSEVSLSTKTYNPLSATVPAPRSDGRGVTLLVDNFDSFTWNIYQYLSQLGESVVVLRNNVSLEECLAVNPVRVVISPGPGWPSEAGVSNEVIKAFAGKVPILGVCLGHECIVELFGGKIVHCGEVMHGKTSKIVHDGKGVFTGLPNGLEAIRYHSLAADEKTIDTSLFEISARTENGIIMALRHKTLRIESLQFHPESIKTEYGMEMLQTFLSYQSPTW